MKKRASKAKDRNQAGQEIEAQRALDEVEQPGPGDNPKTTGEEKGPVPGSNDEDPQREGWDSAVTSHAGTGDEITPDAAEHQSETLPEASAPAAELERKLAVSTPVREGRRGRTIATNRKAASHSHNTGSQNRPRSKQGRR